MDLSHPQRQHVINAVVGFGLGLGVLLAVRGHARKPASVRPAPSPPPKPVTRRVEPRGSAGLAGGLLLQRVRAGAFERPTWVEVPLGEITVTVAADNLRASVGGGAPVRLPVTWPETALVARALGDALGEELIAPSQRIVDAIRAAAKIKTTFRGQGTGAMLALATSEAYSRDVDRQVAEAIAAGRGAAGDLVSGHEKYWILHPRLDQATNDATLARAGLPSTGPNPAVNYGAWDGQGRLIQTVGGRHNGDHYDYSQLYRPVRRWARRADGSRVDLLRWIEGNEGVPARFTDLFRLQGVAGSA
jgi:hypothetical protein